MTKFLTVVFLGPLSASVHLLTFPSLPSTASSEDRECGLNTLALLDEATAASAIRNFRLVRVAGPLMVDSNLSVKHSAVGSLKNLSLVSAEVCEEMVEQV